MTIFYSVCVLVLRSTALLLLLNCVVGAKSLAVGSLVTHYQCPVRPKTFPTAYIEGAKKMADEGLTHPTVERQ